MSIRLRPANAVLLVALLCIGGCATRGGISPQARSELDALRQMTEQVSDPALREQMQLRLANLETELAAGEPAVAWPWSAPDSGVVKLAYHPFTCIGYADQNSLHAGIEVRVKPLDANGQVDRVRGTFRFELFQFVPANEQRKGRRLGMWDVDLSSADAEQRHWERHSQSYFFQLQYPDAIEPDTKFVLTTMFTDRTGRRVFLEDVRTYRQ